MAPKKERPLMPPGDLWVHAMDVGQGDSILVVSPDGFVLANHPEVVACFDHGGTYGTNQYTEYDTAADTRRWTLAATDTIDLGPSMTAEVLHGDTSSSNENNNSLVVRLTYGNTTFLLGGDCEAPCESSIDPGPIQVYKAHHHVACR
jgi:beta-lactamase superfamily II metal-dependent hydrolase